MNTLQCVERSTGSKSCRNREQGSLSVELVIAIPIVVLITLFVVQGFLAASVISSTQADNAVAEALPDWVVIDHVSRNCTGENCVAVTTRVPIGIPWITSSELTVTRSASFPRGDS